MTDNDAILLDSLRLIYASADTWGMYYSLDLNPVRLAADRLQSVLEAAGAAAALATDDAFHSTGALTTPPSATEMRNAALEAGHHKLDNDRQVFFYEQDFYVLSNFSSFNLRIGALTFPTSEHAYHYEKFCAVDGDDDDDDKSVIRFAIMDAPSAHEAFKIAERSKAERRQDWDAVKVDIMRDILRAKADQHEYVRRKLLATGDRELIEDSWRDDFWGWGPNRDGQNMLGKLWMEIRSELRALIDNTEGSEGAK